MFRRALRRWNGARLLSRATAVMAVVGALGIVAPAAAQVSGQPPAAYTLTADRISPPVIALISPTTAATDHHPEVQGDLCHSGVRPSQ